MRYLRVRWVHSLPGEPVELLSELDDRAREVRKVEVFANGSAGFAGRDEATEETRLSEGPLPTLDEIAADPQFLPEEISREEFEKAWEAAHHVGNRT
jgi:hypothetical protein